MIQLLLSPKTRMNSRGERGQKMKKMAKKKAIMRKVLCCLVVVLFLASAMPFSVFAVKASDSCYTQEWYRICSNGETYTINVVTKAPISNLDQKPLFQTNPIEAIYVVDDNGDLLTDESLVRNLVIDAQSSARFINDMDLWKFTQSIYLDDLYSETRNDDRGNEYLIVGPKYTEDSWRERFLYECFDLPPPFPPIKGLNTYHHRVAIWEAVILDAVLQPDIYDKPEDNEELLRDLSNILKASGLDLKISDMIIQGKDTFTLTPQNIIDHLAACEDTPVSTKVKIHFAKFTYIFCGLTGYISTGLELEADAMRMFYLHTLANARAEERLDAIGEYIHTNHDELDVLDPALEEGYKRAKEKFENKICKTYYDKLGNLLRSACDLDKAVTLSFSTGYLIAAFKSHALGQTLLPYYFSWEGYKTLRDKNEKAQRLTLAATLQRHLAGHITAGGLETLQSDLTSSDPKNKNSIETALTLYNINQYLGWYFYRNYYEILDAPVFGPVQDYFTGGRLSDYLNHLDFQASLDKANCRQTQKPYLLTEFDLYEWHDYSWLVNKLTYAHFNILVNPEKDWYVPGETAKVTVDIKNIGAKKSFWLGVSFKDQIGGSTKYDPQIIITPQSASIDPCETKTFLVEWTIPADAPIGQYEIAVNCWKDATFTEKCTDDLEWEPIFSILPLPEFTPLDLCMVLDRSGSMGDSMGGETKMQGAKEAATGVVNVLFPQDRVSIISFSDTATTNIDLTSDFSAVKTKINQLSADGYTSFGAGLKSALDQFNAHGNPDHIPAILFMSDGKHNTAPHPEAYVTECKSRGIPIFTVGFATSESQVDVTKLKSMSDATGGEYLFVSDIFDLQNIFLKLQHMASGWESVATYIGQVNQGETVTAGTFYVDPAIENLRVTLNWPGSNLDLELFDPNGRQIDFGTSDVVYSGDTKPEYVIIKAPQSGTWTVKVYGKSIGSSEMYYVLVTKYVPQAQKDTGLIAEWRFDEGSGNIMKDSSSNGNDGTVHGAAFVDGISGYALNFDGIDDYVNVEHKEIFNLTQI